MDAQSLIARFSFPLNVYAHALCLEQGRLDWLHYGLFESADEPIASAQARSTELLMSRLPTQPARMLEVGIGVGTLLERLTRLGHRVTGITPDAAQIDYVRQIVAPEADLRCVRFEDFASDEKFDVVLFQESGQYIPQQYLMAGAAKHLKSGGELIVLDEFVEQPDPAHADHLHVAAAFIGVAEQEHFKLLESQTLGAQAAPTVDTILGLIERWRDRLTTDLSLNSAQIDALVEGTKNYRTAYASGRYGYRLLRFRYEPSPRWRVAEETIEDAPAMRAMFADVFGSTMDKALWQWKYGDNRARAVGVWEADGRMVAHYAGFRRTVRMFGNATPALQIGDVMVRTDARGTLSRKGPFFLAASYFLANNVGYDKSALVAFGFPNDRAMRVAAKQGLYGECGRMLGLGWPVADAQLPAPFAIRPFDLAEPGWAQEVDQLWLTMADNMRESIVGERSAVWMHQRYIERPAGNYRAIWLFDRNTGQNRALLVVRDAGDGLEWLDLVAAPCDWPLAALAARAFAQQCGKHHVNMWISEAFAERMGPGANHQDLGIALPCCVWTPGPAIESQRDRWFLLGGDTDFL